MTFKILVFATVVCALLLPLVGGAGMEKGPPAVFASPMRIALAPGQRLLVTDHELKQVIEFKSRTLEEIQTFPIDGRPLGIALLNDRIYVGNVSRRRVEVFTRTGDLLHDLGGP